MPRVAVNVQDVPSVVRDVVERDAQERDVSVNDVLGEILAGHYDMSWESSEYPYPKGPQRTGSDQWVIRMPEKLKGMIRDNARASGLPAQVHCLRIIERHYGLSITPARRRGYQGIDPVLIREARERHASGESIRSLARDLRLTRNTITRAVRA